MPVINSTARTAHIEAIHRFNRLYTQRVQVPGKQAPCGELSPPDARILLEIGHRTSSSGAELARALNLHPGYVSRILTRLHRHELLIRTTSSSDGRLREFALSVLGQQGFEKMERASQTRIDSLLDELSPQMEGELAHAVNVLQGILGGEAQTSAPIVLREHKAGDMGWIVQRHAQLYQQEYDFDVTFEALCARIAAEFIENFDADAERCWIAERDGQRLGSALVVNAGESNAQIRLVLVEPQARGSGLGRLLVRECIRYATQRNYKFITLWTNDNLHAARHIYASEGFELVSSEAHYSFGHDLVGENWQRPLR